MSPGRKRLILVACILGTTVTTVDATVVNVALPAIRGDLGGGLAGQQWVANAYLLTLSSLLLVGGSLGDLFGERRVFMLGVGGFGATSLLCAAAPTVEALVAARALQGVSGALLTPAGLAVIVATFGPEERGKAIGSWTAWGAIGTVIGPLVGGQIVDAASWRWIFAINVPLVLGTLVLVARAMPADRPRSGTVRVDWAGGALCGAGLGGITFGLIQQPQHGWGDPGVFGPLLAGVGLLVAFVLHERRTPAPMLPLSLFSRRNFAIGNAQTLLIYGGLGLQFFFLVLYLQQVAGYSATAAGAASLPVTVLMFLLSRRFGALADRYGPRLFMGGGPLIAACGTAMLTQLGRHVDYLTDLLPALVLFGLGLSMTVAPLTATVLADADEHNAGIASGVNNAIARVASLIWTAAVGALIAAQFAGALDDRLGGRAPLSRGGQHAVVEAKAAPLAPLDAVNVPGSERPRLERAVDGASVEAFHVAMGAAATLVAIGGLLGTFGIVNARRRVPAQECPGGQFAGAPAEAAGPSPDAPEVAGARA